MSEKFAILRQRLEPRVAEVIERYGVADLLPTSALLDAIVEGLISPEKRLFLKHRQRILSESGNRPACWICDLPIPMDAPQDAHSCFSIDHVTERCNGGSWLGSDNLRPAHRLCNSLRSNPVRPKRLRSYFAFLQALATAHGKEASLEIHDVLHRIKWVTEVGIATQTACGSSRRKGRRRRRSRTSSG